MRIATLCIEATTPSIAGLQSSCLWFPGNLVEELCYEREHLLGGLGPILPNASVDRQVAGPSDDLRVHLHPASPQLRCQLLCMNLEPKVVLGVGEKERREGSPERGDLLTVSRFQFLER